MATSGVGTGGRPFFLSSQFVEGRARPTSQPRPCQASRWFCHRGNRLGLRRGPEGRGAFWKLLWVTVYTPRLKPVLSPDHHLVRLHTSALPSLIFRMHFTVWFPDAPNYSDGLEICHLLQSVFRAVCTLSPEGRAQETQTRFSHSTNREPACRFAGGRL